MGILGAQDPSKMTQNNCWGIIFAIVFVSEGRCLLGESMISSRMSLEKLRQKAVRMSRRNVCRMKCVCNEKSEIHACIYEQKSLILLVGFWTDSAADLCSAHQDRLQILSPNFSPQRADRERVPRRTSGNPQQNPPKLTYYSTSAEGPRVAQLGPIQSGLRVSLCGFSFLLLMKQRFFPSAIAAKNTCFFHSNASLC